MTRGLKPIALLIALSLMAWLAVRAANPPRVTPINGAAQAFSAARAFRDVHVIAQRPHPTASADNQRVRAYLSQRLMDLGLTVETRSYLVDPTGLKTLARWSGRLPGGSELTNIVAILGGRDQRLPAVTLMAHYDTVWGSPGGGDDSAGVATILEVLRAIRARGLPNRDIVVLLTDGEEIGLSGAKAFWPTEEAARHVGVVINLEARGTGGRAAMFETGDGNGAMMRLFAAHVAHPVANSMAVMAYRLMPEQTDFTISKAHGLPGFNFAIIGRPQYYHSPSATADRLDLRSLQDLGDQVLGLTMGLAYAGSLPPKAKDAVFFDLAGRHLLVYAPERGWLILGVAALLLTLAWLRTKPSIPTLGWGATLSIWMALNAGLGLGLLGRIATSTHTNYFDRLAQLPKLEAMCLLVCCAALTAAPVLRAIRARWVRTVPTLILAVLALSLHLPLVFVLACAAPACIIAWMLPKFEACPFWGEWLGGLFFLLGLAVVTQILAPLAAWLLAWPLLIVALMAAFCAWSDRHWRTPWGWAAAIASGAMVGAFLLPIAHLTFLGLGASGQAFAGGWLIPIALAYWPFVATEHPRPIAHLAPVALLVAALVLSVQIRHDPIALTVPSYAPDK